MAQRFDSLTRSQLIGGILATGVLAACGGRINPTSASPTGFNAFAKRSGGAAGIGINNSLPDKILSNATFDNVDKESLKRLFDPSARLAIIQRPYFAAGLHKPQTTTVITEIQKDGISITASGTYKLGKNIQWNPSDKATSAIKIEASDVTLDLAGFTLTSTGTDKSQGLAGVVVSGPAANVTVRNGTIAGFTEYGVLATAVVGFNISGITVTGLSMKNLAVRNTTPCGLHASISADIAIAGCTVSGLNVTTDSCAGIQLVGTSQAKVSNCRMSGFVNNDGAVQGYSYIGCSDITTIDCSATTFQSHFNGNTKATGHTVIGYCPIFCENLDFRDCSSAKFTGCCDDCHGFSVFLDNYVTVSGFKAQNVVDGVAQSNSGAKATGLEVFGNFITITDCTVSGIKSINPQDKQSAGFSAWGSVIKFERCKASNVTVVKNLVPDALAVGFGWAPDPRAQFAHVGAVSTTYVDCTAQNCEVGFDTWFHVNSAWICPKTINCKTDVLIQPGAKRTISCDPCSECDPEFDVTLTNIASGNTVRHCK
jgi:hypothetical protein